MTFRLTTAALLLLIPGVAILRAADAQSHPELVQKATWKNPTAGEVKSLALAWLKDRHAEPAIVEQVEKLWAEPAVPPAAPAPVGDAKGAEAKTPEGNTADAKTPDAKSPDEKASDAPKPAAQAALTVDEIFDRLTATFALGDAEARSLVELCSRRREALVPPSFAWLNDEKTPAVERHNLRLLYVRWLAQERLFDEALVKLNGLAPDDVVDPASLLFYQAVVFQRTLQREPGLLAIGRLLEPNHELPRRYASLARLIQADLGGLKDESLDHIARRMDDITRRLDLGRGGPKVREVEDGVIKSLDKLIEEVEKQQAAAAAAMASGQGTIRSSNPAPDSVPMGGKGPGNVTKKDIGDTSGWGDLPAKQRDEALQEIGKAFPAHYRDVIEEYFRKLASGNGEKSDK